MIVATAGHVDHGKTTLVRALSGVDTDRLPEEKQRGLTIDLGFAYADAGDGAMLGFVDVPGHERFVKNMLAGVPAVDHALLVIAADDGVMPQTVEHLAILDLLGIAEATVAISKVDRVDAARLTAVDDEVTRLLAPTALAGAPLFHTSGETGQGVDELGRHLRTLAQRHAGRTARGRFRFAIDRSFIVPGSGLVVTGAVFSGTVQAGEQLLLSPAGIDVRVRGLRALDRDADIGRAGERCALNIAGSDLERAALHRGDWLVAPGTQAPSRRIDARLRLLASEQKPLRQSMPVHVHLGAADLTGRVAPLAAREIAPGDEALVQLLLDSPTVAVHGDRFVLRDQSAQRTIAGGMVVDPNAPARGRSRPQRLAVLDALCADDDTAALTAVLDLSPRGVALEPLVRGRNLSAADADALLADGAVVVVADAAGNIAITRTHWQALLDAVIDAVAAWHGGHADELGPSEVQLRLQLAEPPAAGLLRGSVLELARAGRLVREGVVVHLPEHRPRPSAADQRLWEEAAPLLTAGGLRPPRLRELAEQMGMEFPALEAFARRAVRFGLLLPVAPNRFFPPEAVRGLAAVAEQMAAEAEDASFDASGFKDRSGIGRNLTIEVLEYFDNAGFTRRTGNVRRILRPADEVFGAG